MGLVMFKKINYLKGNRPEDFLEDIDDDYYEEEEWQMAS